jgi:hypothetical protein
MTDQRRKGHVVSTRRFLRAYLVPIAAACAFAVASLIVLCTNWLSDGFKQSLGANLLAILLGAGVTYGIVNWLISHNASQQTRQIQTDAANWINDFTGSILFNFYAHYMISGFIHDMAREPSNRAETINLHTVKAVADQIAAGEATNADFYTWLELEKVFREVARSTDAIVRFTYYLRFGQGYIDLVRKVGALERSVLLWSAVIDQASLTEDEWERLKQSSSHVSRTIEAALALESAAKAMIERD